MRRASCAVGCSETFCSYGLTESRLYTMWVMGWVAFVLAWLVFTVLHGQRERFAAGAIVAAMVALFTLNVVNPDALIARTNTARSGTAQFDAAHASQLSGDAVPALLAALDRLPADARCQLSQTLLERWGTPGAEVGRTDDDGA